MTFLQNVKLTVVHATLEILLFIDFLEDLPQKTIKHTLKIGSVFFVFIFFVIGLALESQNHSLYNSIKERTVPEYTFIPLQDEYSLPVLTKSLPLPSVSAKSYLVVSTTTGKILSKKNENIQYAPASTTKMMTALVARDLYALDEYLTIPEECTTIDTQKVGFLPGERVLVSDLIYSLLINSAGDSACTLAFGRGSYQEFVHLMNKYASKYKLTRTNFSNPIGLDGVNDEHVSTAYDLYILSKYLISDNLLKSIVSQKEYVLTSGKFPRTIYSTNSLLWGLPGSVGIKTGTTEAAGEVLVYQYKNEDKDLIIVVMGSDDRFTDVRKILSWSLTTHKFSY